MPSRISVLTAAVIVAAGLVALVGNIELPIVRNSFLYASAAESIIRHGFDPLAVVADETLSQGKPIGFPLLCAPVVYLVGLNAGMKLVSFLATVLLVAAALLFFPRVNRYLHIDARWMPLELVLLFFNPLMIYQFWSGYPDTLFAAEVLLAFVLTDRIVDGSDRDKRRDIALLGVVIYVAILTKLYGLILGLACPLYILSRWRTVWRSRATLRWLVLLFAALGAAVALARMGWNPTIDFGAGRARQHSVGYSELVDGVTTLSSARLLPVVRAWFFSLLLTFHFALLFLVRRGRVVPWPWRWTGFAGLLVIGLLPFGREAAYNIRYFIPALPFVVVAITHSLHDLRQPGLRAAALGAYAGLAGLLTINFNSPAVYRALGTLNDRLIHSVLNRDEWLDNLRLDAQLDLGQQLAQVNRTVEVGGVLNWHSRYGGNATRGIIERLGLRPDIEVRYPLRNSDFPRDRISYLLSYDEGDWVPFLVQSFTLTRYETGLIRLEPVVYLTQPVSGQLLNFGEPLPIEATVDSGVDRVEFLVDDEIIGIDRDPPFAAVWLDGGVGRHEAAAEAVYPSGHRVRSEPHPVFVAMKALERVIERSEDDAAERDGRVFLATAKVELTDDGSVGAPLVGLRFNDVQLPTGSAIRAAYLQLTAGEATSGRTVLTVRGERTASAAPFQVVRGSLAGRLETSAHVVWEPDPWLRRGERSARQRSPDLSAIVREVIETPGWQPGGSMAFLIRGTGRRVAHSFDGVGGRAQAPALYIEYATTTGSLSVSDPGSR